jgi:hypothetical protein
MLTYVPFPAIIQFFRVPLNALVRTPWVSGFGGLVVSMLAPGTQDRGFAPSRIFFRRKNPQYAFLRKGSKAHVADLRHVKEPYNLPWKSQVIG